MILPADADASGLDERYAPVVRLWTLRALMRTNAVSAFVGEHRFQDVAVARLLGWTDAAPPGYSEVWALKELQDRLSALELEAPELPADAVLSENITGLAARIGLTDIERDLLHLCAVRRHHDQFTAVLEMVGPLTRGSVCRLLAECLDRPVQAVQAALAPRGNLCRAALLSVDDGDRYNFPMKVDMLYGLAEGLVQEHEDLLDLFNRVVVGSPPPRLGLGSFPHLAEDIAILRGLLGGAMRAHTQGVNVLIHGRPGTGKTEFVRALVAACGVRLLEIPCEELGGGPRDGGKRFKSFRFAQSLLGSVGGDVLLFDKEIERRTGIARNTIKSWLRRGQMVEPKYPPRVVASKLAAYADQTIRISCPSARTAEAPSGSVLAILSSIPENETLLHAAQAGIVKFR